MIESWSLQKTSQVVLELLRERVTLPGDGPGAGSPAGSPAPKILDVGAGKGSFAHTLGGLYEGAGLVPKEHLFACDVDPTSFQYGAIDCQALGSDGILPFETDTFDVVLSIEVVEHVEDQFLFMRELRRVAKPGALVVVTTPNTHNINSRVRNLTWSFPLLYDPLPLSSHDAKHLGGHIHPISPYFLCYNASRAELESIEIFGDRRKRSAYGLLLFFGPLVLLGRWKNQARLRHKHPGTLEQNRAWLDRMGGLEMLMARTTVMVCRKPA